LGNIFKKIIMFKKDNTIAIVGASNNKEKYGHQVLENLHNAGFKVIPINPKEKEILNLKVFSNLSSVKDKIDSVVFVTKPEVTLKVLEEVKELGIKDVWMQPGAESGEAIEYCSKNGLHCINNACIMMEKGNLT